MGWHEQGDGKLFLGVNIENGRIKDEGELRIKAGLRKILETYRFNARITAKQSVIFCDIDPSLRSEIDQILTDHGMKKADELTLIRRFSMSCPALPMCGLSITESERVMPALITEFEEEHHRLSKRLCPPLCSRYWTRRKGRRKIHTLPGWKLARQQVGLCV